MGRPPGICLSCRSSGTVVVTVTTASPPERLAHSAADPDGVPLGRVGPPGPESAATTASTPSRENGPLPGHRDTAIPHVAYHLDRTFPMREIPTTGVSRDGQAWTLLDQLLTAPPASSSHQGLFGTRISMTQDVYLGRRAVDGSASLALEELIRSRYLEDEKGLLPPFSHQTLELASRPAAHRGR
jgi:hypothetical protein